VVEKGKSVEKLQIGDTVVSPFSTCCGSCFYCQNHLQARCENGQLFGFVDETTQVGLQGAQAEFVVVPFADSTLVSLPPNISPDLGLLLTDILPTAFFCASNAAITGAGLCVVIGCGPVGLLTILAAQELGADRNRLFAIDLVASRLEHAKRFGAIPINSKSTDPVSVILSASQGRGADSVMEVVGGGIAVSELAFRLVRKGGTISSVGVQTEERFGFTPIDAYNKNLTYKSGRCSARDWMEKLVPFMEKRRDDLISIITHRFPLSEGEHAYHIFANRLDNCIKVVFQC